MRKDLARWYADTEKVAEWRKLIATELFSDAMEVISNYILSIKVIDQLSSDLNANALVNAGKEKAFDIVNLLYAMGIQQKIKEQISEPWEYLKPKELNTGDKNAA